MVRFVGIVREVHADETFSAYFDVDDTTEVRKTPRLPRSWANFSLLYLYYQFITGMHGPTCIFWVNLTPFALEVVMPGRNRYRTLPPAR
jgi:hypothetical protein